MPAKRIATLSLITALATGLARSAVGADEDVAWPPERAVRAIREAAPGKPLVAPVEPRKVLVYGRVRTHPESVRCCFCAMEVLGEKTGAFQATASGDPLRATPVRGDARKIGVSRSVHWGKCEWDWCWREVRACRRR